MRKFTDMFKNLCRDDNGATAIEYGLLAALISVVIIAAVQLIGTQLDVTFDKIGAALQAANAT
ncbi:MAG: Flp family type IVb pilin [Rhodospirillales bacterium]|nr:Flp family type IVb pilin [Rhodospirillales bacterium]